MVALCLEMQNYDLTWIPIATQAPSEPFGTGVCLVPELNSPALICCPLLDKYK